MTPYNATIEGIETEWYLKREADARIKELDIKNRQLQRRIEFITR